MTKWLIPAILVLVLLAAGLWAAGCGPRAQSASGPEATMATPAPAASTPAPASSATGTAPGAQVQKVVYVCPMHPDYTSDKPGKCPKCGMTLVKKQ